MVSANQVHDKIQEIILELKERQLWKTQSPGWVTDFTCQEIMCSEDFAGWLQFVYLPNLMRREAGQAAVSEKYIVPQAVKYFAEDIKKGRLLQLLVELDSLA